MEPERWQQIEAVFQSVLDCDPATRGALIDSSCAGDAELRREVESLLASFQKAGFTDSPAFQEGAQLLEHSANRLTAGRKLGPYRILREIGHGGMGVVYLAARADEAFEKQVAIKILPAGMNCEDIIKRFRSERQILATFDHPNITRLLDGGATEDGLPYLVMEYIEGEPIDQYCDAHKLNITARLKLFQGVCAAVRYAHQNLVVHRDIKPSNVLVTKEGAPRLLDFGIAKLLAPGTASDEMTMTAMHPLTPEYASPEQVRGGAITTTTDVYSLGVLLYHLLTGRRPYRSEASLAGAMARAICEEEPEKLSEVVMHTNAGDNGSAAKSTPAAMAAVREGTVEKLRRRLAGDLDNIVLMAMRKEPQRRYASTDQLSDDISRHLNNLPVAARPDTRGYRLGKFVRRNRSAVTAATLLFLTLTGGIATTLWQAHIARQQRDRARLEHAKATRMNTFLKEMISYSGVSGISPTHKHDATVADMLDDAAGRIEKELDDQPEVRAEMLATIGDTYEGLAKYDLATRYLRKAYDLDVNLYGLDKVQTASVMHALADLCYLTGDYTGAGAWFQKALPIYRRHANDPALEVRSLVGMLSDAAFVSRALGNLDEAEALWHEALSYGPRLPAENHAQAITPKTFLAQLYLGRGDIQRADTLASEASSELRAWGRDRFSLGQSLIDLGNIRRAEQRYPEAESLIHEGTALYAQVQGANHPNVAFGLTSLAWAYYYDGKYDLAEEAARKALKIVETLPNGSHYRAGVYGPLGLSLNKTERSKEAERLLREALANYQQNTPKHSYPMAVALGNLGECLTDQERYAEAEPFLTESYETIKSIHVPQSPMLREAAQRLANLYRGWGKPEKAGIYATQQSRPK
jgi:eukaryotic-like serine/threonine-protein kinase